MEMSNESSDWIKKYLSYTRAPPRVLGGDTASPDTPSPQESDDEGKSLDSGPVLVRPTQIYRLGLDPGALLTIKCPSTNGVSSQSRRRRIAHAKPRRNATGTRKTHLHIKRQPATTPHWDRAYDTAS